ncbi:Fic family protein [Ramlibacter sp. AN1133]|uniref:Fic family protein n=1 Tax=Ramlibacter sp. AN1133 TaxID=3133429 RepID=UPI0030BDF047
MARVLADYLAGRCMPMLLQDVLAEIGIDAHQTTVYRWMQRAREHGWVEMNGQGRTARWTASLELRNEAARRHFLKPVEKRQMVGYNEAFLDEYVPNQSFYLTAVQRERLHQQCRPGTANFVELSEHDQSLFMCGLSYASSSLEGNQYDFASTEKLLIEGMAKEGASEQETIMVLNHREAVRYLIENIHYPQRRMDLHTRATDLKNVHALLSQHLLRDPAMCGTLRKGPVRIKHSAYSPPSLHELIEREFLTIADKAQDIQDPYEQAMFLLVHLPYLQPFEDCNKRTARVACSIPLLKRGVVPMSWMDVTHKDYIDGILGVYERNNVSLLSEVFVEGFIRSSERFNVMRAALDPNVAVVKYRTALRRTVRAVVLGGDVDFEEDVDPADHKEFCLFVEKELDLLRHQNAAALLRYRLMEGDVDAWQNRDADVETVLAREREPA